MTVEKVDSLDADLENMLGDEFSRLAAQHKLTVNYTPFNFIAKENAEVVGLITGHAYYNEVYVSDLIVLEKLRKTGIGSKLLQKVENHFRVKGYELIALTTYSFQALDFYLKNGFEIEYVRENSTNENLTKYYLRKYY